MHKIIFILTLGLLIVSCRPKTHELKPVDPALFRVEPAKDWNSLMVRDSGWFAADGIFSIPLDGKDSHCESGKPILMIFSDTYTGVVKNNIPQHGSIMVNNSIAYLEGCRPHPDNIQFLINKNDEGQPIAFFKPDNENARPGQYYWLGDGFVNSSQNGVLYLFAYHIEMTGPNVFDFEEHNVSLIVIPDASSPPFHKARQLNTPFHIKHPVIGIGNLGAGVYVNTDWAGAQNPDGYIYVYGCIGSDKNLIVARSPAESFDEFHTWTFWDGNGWTKNIENISPSTHAVSNELSVTDLPDGRYLLTFQVMGLSEKVGCRIGESLTGPWSDIIDLYITPESEMGIFTYNAKAHPALSPPGELLISYNTITLDFWNDIKKDASIYRPRFIRLFYE
ncbi:MAG TPA: hypothetical protein PKC30_14050 [Saprospiraceae bacterium]|nr:hypothetical protein [Saprospiraceae bacterium]